MGPISPLYVRFHLLQQSIQDAFFSAVDGVTRRGGSSRTRLSLTKVVEIRPPNVPKEAARMLQMMLFCVK